MNTHTNKYDEILSLFVSNDELRPIMTKPCRVGNFVLATDAHALIKLPMSLCDIDYHQDYEFYKVDFLFDVERTIAGIVDFGPIEEWFLTVPMVAIYQMCPTCDGEREVYCYHCKHSHRCDDCDGTGNGDKIGEEPRHYDKYNLDGVGFSYKNLYRLSLLAKHENTEVKWTFKHESKGNIFDVNGIEVVLMPMVL